MNFYPVTLNRQEAPSEVSGNLAETEHSEGENADLSSEHWIAIEDQGTNIFKLEPNRVTAY